MKCDQCGTENQGVRFCVRCGGAIKVPKAPPGTSSFFVFKVRTSCLECGSAVVFDGPTLVTPCRECQSPVEVDAKRWKSFLDLRSNAAELHGLTEGQLKNSTIVAGATFSIGWGPQRPICSCGAPLDLSKTPPGTDGAIRCACGASTTTFPPPAWLLAVEPDALQVFGAARPFQPGGASVDAAAERRPVSFACPDCGGNLKITTESPRVLACGFCKADLFLPDPLWRALHPVKKRTPWVVAFRS
jgi:hypothetical protein